MQCVYCHNHRSADVVSTDGLLAFLRDQIVELRNFQMGCIMEPTLDDRMADLLLAVRRSPAPPTEELILQTNGILLHRHSAATLTEAGLTRLAVSIDSADPDVHRALRGGTSIAKVVRNIRAFHEACPAVEIHFITTVTRANLPTLDQLVTRRTGAWRLAVRAAGGLLPSRQRRRGPRANARPGVAAGRVRRDGRPAHADGSAIVPRSSSPIRSGSRPLSRR